MRISGGSIYGSTTDLDAALARLEKDEAVLPQNRQLILKFANTWLAKGFTKVRVVKLVYCLRRLSGWLGKPFGQATKEDIITLVGSIESKEYAENTKYDFKVILKMFYKWLKGDDEQMPREVSWLRPRVRNHSHKLPESLLTEEEVLRMAEAAKTPRDKAMVLVLYETGCRIGELLSLRVKNVSFDQYGATLRVTGKTGDRRVRIISSAPALASWLEHYEGAKDPEAVLWPPRSNNNHATNLAAMHRSVYKILETLAKKAGINKKVYPHLFRHSRATFLASKLTEAQMKEYFGWTQSSDMASVYVHLSGRDVDQALLALQGMAKPEDKKEEQMKVCFCPRCREKNSPAAKFCLRCGTPMNAQMMAQVEEERRNADEIMNKLMSDPEFKKMIVEKLIKNGLAIPV